jgi:3D (Asp-Asp-Asp) domain-containing protein/septal ring factor EnvC (AmiA/AmiB activator)
VLASCPVQTRSGPAPARLAAILAGVLLATALPASGGADPSSTFAKRAQDLRAENASLATRSSSALLGLYALDTRLASTRTELSVLQRRAASLERRQADVRIKLRLARRALAVSRRQLAERLHLLYVQGETDPLAVLLGADSLDDAMTRIDELERTASLNESVIEQTLAARKALRALARTLRAQTAHVRELEAASAASAAALERAVAERRAYLDSLAARQRLNAGQIAGLEAEASAAHIRSEVLAPVSATTTATSRPEVPGSRTAGRTLTVVATGYSLPGRTATGLRTGWGVVAVDPSLIHLGTRLTIPGYGEGVAADVGGSIRGAAIDLWFPTRAQALAWGRRTVTVTLH